MNSLNENIIYIYQTESLVKTNSCYFEKKLGQLDFRVSLFIF